MPLIWVAVILHINYFLVHLYLYFYFTCIEIFLCFNFIIKKADKQQNTVFSFYYMVIRVQNLFAWKPL